MQAPPVRSAVRLLSLATALPPYIVEQERALEYARSSFGRRMPGFETLARVFASTGIQRRYSVQSLDWFLGDHGWPERTSAYLAGACALFEDVVAKALERASLRPGDVDAVMTVSSTGVATPSLEARVLPAMGFRSDVKRIPLFGLGCAGGVTGVANAARIAAGEPGATVLLVTIELCTLSFRTDRISKADLVSLALFGDGAAAAIFRCDEGPAIGRVNGSTEHLWPDTLDIMGWSTDPIGLGVILSRSLPGFIEHEYAAAFGAALKRLGLEREAIGRIVCHPGGTKVLEAIERALVVPIGSLDLEREIMAECGNMSSPTVLFVLERVLERGFHGTALLSALGPGFTASFATLQVDG